MKWTKGKNKYFLFCFFLIASCRHYSEKEIMTGIWKYKSITKNNEMVIRITDEDFLKLNADGTFNYELYFINKKKQGNWEYANHQLQLKYQNPDTIRLFEIEILSKKELIFSEDNIKYKFVKE